MKKSDIVIIGGSAAGLTAAITTRRSYPNKNILLIRKEKLVPIPCGIPYIFGTFGDPDKNLVPDTLLEKHNVEILVDEVIELDRRQQTLVTKSGETIGYDKLILATGSRPVTPPIPGADKENVFPIFKDVPHLIKMQQKLQAVKKLAVIGGGFIGVEFADECNKLKYIEVTIIEMLPYCLYLAFDSEFCQEIEKLLYQRGVKLLTGETVVSIDGDQRANAIRLASGKIIDADMIVIGIGTAANIDLAKKAELRLGPTGSVWVERTMRTTDNNIFACGDCAEKISFFGGKPSELKLASIAASEARIAGANLFGLQRENVGTIGVFSTAIGNQAFAVAGLTEKVALDQGYDVITGVAEGPNRHPGCMPAMANRRVKLVFEKRTKVLIGAQMTGDHAIGELINVASACIGHKMTVDDITCFQMGTHPALTASPVAYQFVNAAESALLSI